MEWSSTRSSSRPEIPPTEMRQSLDTNTTFSRPFSGQFFIRVLDKRRQDVLVAVLVKKTQRKAKDVIGCKSLIKFLCTTMQ